ncbi:HtaA domain-containing protein [Streptomyces roseoverticillatus]|uniref:HtaA domain-containing protein n=1 Tax=Streptomyces roseoverticillatus TaxID=66429 RepID=UPI0033CD171E
MTVTSRRALAALATATVLGATALAVPAFAADTPQTTTGGAPKYSLKDGTLVWGVENIFRDYVAGDGKIEVAEGAKQDKDNGPFTFVDGAGSYDAAKNVLSTTFKGSVHFLAHEKKGQWLLDIKLSDLKVTSDAKSDGKTGSLVADVTINGTTQQDVPLADLDLGAKPVLGNGGGALNYKEIPAKVTAEGEKAFARDSVPSAGFHKGDSIAPVTVSATAAKAAPEPTTGGQGTGGNSGGAAGGAGSTGSTGGTATSGGSSAGASAGSTGTTGQNSGGAAGDTSGSGAQQPDGTLHEGNLDWGLQKYFRDYITGGAKGKIDVSEGAVKTGAGFRFPKGEGKFDATTSTLVAAFKGQVHFTGHEGLLDIKLSNLRVEASGTTGTLFADVANKNGPQVKNEPIAELTVPEALKAKDGIVTLPAVKAKLTEKGAVAFARDGKQYPNFKKGSSLDPVTVAVATKDGAKLPEPPAGTVFANCAEATAAGKAPLRKGDDGYSAQLDTDGDGVACETSTGATTGGAGTTGGTGSTTGAATTGGSGTAATNTSLASTGANTPTAPLLGAAGALVLAGTGAVFATRRRGRGTTQD